MRVLVAMSGGVDSAVAAARMVAAGHEVTGVHFALSQAVALERQGARGCCTLSDARDAARSADIIGIPFYVWDVAERFDELVVEDFVAEYRLGRTPNPCLRCNERIKFAAVLTRALAMGFDAVATGHYAIHRDGRLFRAVDPRKDQSYVLGVLTPDQLAHSLFPLGESRKGEVRAEAQALGLYVHAKPDSYDICFIPDGDTAGFLRRRLGAAPGPVVDIDGARVGEHDGAFGFTIGQRKGLHLGRPAADGRPRYVVATSPETRTVTVGPREALAVTRLAAVRPTWLSDAFRQAVVASADGGAQVAVRMQFRAHGAAESGSVSAIAGADPAEVACTFDAPQFGVAPGQTVVFYDGDRVLGSATIARTERSAQ